jgi:hypothetical protein
VKDRRGGLGGSGDDDDDEDDDDADDHDDDDDADDRVISRTRLVPCRTERPFRVILPTSCRPPSSPRPYAPCPRPMTWQ